jgi:protein-S-isoprenylcysteine O-methyltransferase Ste14
MALLEEFESQGNWLFQRRSFLPIIICIPLLIIYVIQIAIYKQMCYSELQTFLEIGFAISLIGLIIRIYTIAYTAHNTSGRNTANQVADSINTTGIYSIVRHPLYFSNYIIWLGVFISVGNVYFIVILSLIFWIYYERIMFAEEQYLRKKFQKNYTNWANSTNAFIPNFKNFKKPQTNFNHKKVIKKEKDGLVSIAIVFTVLDTISQLLIFQTIRFYYWISIFGVIFIAYLAIRYLKYHSKLFD